MNILKKGLINGLTYLGVERRLLTMFPEKRVLLFHRVGDNSDPLWPALSEKAFRYVIRYVKENFEVVPLEKENFEKQTNKPEICISFDDGFADFYHIAWPILQEEGITHVNHNFIGYSIKYGIPPWTSILHALLWQRAREKAHIEVPGLKIKIEEKTIHEQYQRIFEHLISVSFSELSTYLNQELLPEAKKLELPEMMTKEKVRELYGEGLCIGAHGDQHLMLHNFISTNEIKGEIQNSKNVIEEVITDPIRTYSLLNGACAPGAIQILKEEGFEYVLFSGLANPKEFSTESSLVKCLNRISIHSENEKVNRLKIALNKR